MCVPGGHRKRAGRGVSYSWRVVKTHEQRAGKTDRRDEPEVLQGIYLDPFKQWTPQELIKIGVSTPMMFEPGANWGYCHTNYVILGQVLEQVTRMPLAQAMRQYILDPMDLKQTQSFSTPQIPEPVLHTFSSERRAELHVAAGTPFYEESRHSGIHRGPRPRERSKLRISLTCRRAWRQWVPANSCPRNHWLHK